MAPDFKTRKDDACPHGWEWKSKDQDWLVNYRGDVDQEGTY